MEFRLLYQGSDLVSNGGPSKKHSIRRAFHPQIRQLWRTHPLLKKSAFTAYFSIPGSIDEDQQSANFEQVARDRYLEEVGKEFSRGAFNFVPLVQDEHSASVNLDILFLRPDSNPLISAGGDIDNRMKTLFDALQIPESINGLGGTPEQDEQPLFVLLQNDRMISQVRITTDRLLMLPPFKALNANEVFLVIDVQIKRTEAKLGNWIFE